MHAVIFVAGSCLYSYIVAVVAEMAWGDLYEFFAFIRISKQRHSYAHIRAVTATSTINIIYVYISYIFMDLQRPISQQCCKVSTYFCVPGASEFCGLTWVLYLVNNQDSQIMPYSQP